MFGETEVVPAAGDPGGGQQQVRIPAAGVEPPRGDAEGVVAAPGTGRFDGLGQKAGELPRPQRRRLGPNDVTVDRVAQPHLEPAAARAADEQPVALEVVRHRRAAEGHQFGGAQRLTEGEHLQEVAFVARHFPEPGLDELREPAGRLQPPVESPDPEVVAQRSILEGAEDEFAQE